jgi:hypothetical protein
LSAGAAPPLPESGWKVDYAAALQKWLLTSPPSDSVGVVASWVDACKLLGPPGDATAVGDDFFLASVHGTPVVVYYLLVLYEYLVLIKEFR